MKFDIDHIRALADLAIEKNLAEITVGEGDKSITVKLPAGNVVMNAAPAMAVAAAPQAAAEPAKPAPKATASEDHLLKVTAPMVGTFYSAPSPDSPPFVAIGASVSKGQTLCIIEAMKMMNELESEVSGKVVKILIENGKPVEFGQVLMLVDPG